LLIPFIIDLQDMPLHFICFDALKDTYLLLMPFTREATRESASEMRYATAPACAIFSTLYVI